MEVVEEEDGISIKGLNESEIAAIIGALEFQKEHRGKPRDSKQKMAWNIADKICEELIEQTEGSE